MDMKNFVGPQMHHITQVLPLSANTGRSPNTVILAQYRTVGFAMNLTQFMKYGDPYQLHIIQGEDYSSLIDSKIRSTDLMSLGDKFYELMDQHSPEEAQKRIEQFRIAFEEGRQLRIQATGT